ncbi:MAG: ankyrin repeat domain-containing protein [Gammaproteobacteria bacterium]
MSKTRHPVEQAILDAAWGTEPVSEQKANVLIDSFHLFAERQREDIAIMQAMQKAAPGLKIDIPKELNIHFHDYYYDQTPLAIAAKNNHLHLAKALINAGVSLADNLALVWATEYNHKDMVQLLIQAKVELNIRERYMDPALILAVSACNHEIICLLIEARADLDIQGWNGETALSCAAWKGNVEIAQALIQAGAKLEIVEHHGKRTALDRAIERNQLAMVYFLLSQGAQIRKPQEFCKFLQSCDQTNPLALDIHIRFKNQCEQSENLMTIYREFFPEAPVMQLYQAKLNGLHIANKEIWYFLLCDALSTNFSNEVLNIMIGYMNNMVDYNDRLKDISKLPPITFLEPASVDTALLELKADMLKKAEQKPGFFNSAFRIIHNTLALGKDATPPLEQKYPRPEITLKETPVQKEREKKRSDLPIPVIAVAEEMELFKFIYTIARKAESGIFKTDFLKNREALKPLELKRELQIHCKQYPNGRAARVWQLTQRLAANKPTLAELNAAIENLAWQSDDSSIFSNLSPAARHQIIETDCRARGARFCK